jgi:hypothetical protein
MQHSSSQCGLGRAIGVYEVRGMALGVTEIVALASLGLIFRQASRQDQSDQADYRDQRPMTKELGVRRRLHA